MTQLFTTLRDAEATADECVSLIDAALPELHNRVKARTMLQRIRDRLYTACEAYERTDFVFDEGGPYVKLFDALSFISVAAKSFSPNVADVMAARQSLLEIAR